MLWFVCVLSIETVVRDDLVCFIWRVCVCVCPRSCLARGNSKTCRCIRSLLPLSPREMLFWCCLCAHCCVCCLAVRSNGAHYPNGWIIYCTDISVIDFQHAFADNTAFVQKKGKKFHWISIFCFKYSRTPFSHSKQEWVAPSVALLVVPSVQSAVYTRSSTDRYFQNCWLFYDILFNFRTFSQKSTKNASSFIYFFFNGKLLTCSVDAVAIPH